MRKSKIKALEKAGWRVGSTEEFLNLSEEEVNLIALKQKLIRLVRETRTDLNMTQTELAKSLNSSQSRIAKLEKGSPDVTLDLIIRALFKVGISTKKLAKVISSKNA